MSKILKSFGLAALLVALLAGTGMADSDTTAIDGTVTQSMELTVPTAITGWTLNLGTNTDATKSVTVGSNAASGTTTLKVADKRDLSGATGGAQNANGFMTNTGKTDALDNALKLTVADGAGQVTLDGTDTLAFTLTNPGTATKTVTFSQLVEADDPLGAHDIVVTFTTAHVA
jgi:hypothetical protein